MTVRLVAVVAIAGSATLAAGQENAPGHPPLFPIRIETELPDPAATFDEVRELILAHYYTDQIDARSLYLAAIAGMLRHVSPRGDPERAKLWTPEEYARVANTLKGIRASAGIQSTFNPRDGALTVTAIVTGSPADGVLRRFDRILRINHESLKGKSAADIDRVLNAEPGTNVHLTVSRDVHVLEVELRLEIYESEDVQRAILPDRIGYVRIRRVSRDVSSDLRSALLELRRRSIQALIVDLRDNSGGVFGEGLKLAELFLPPGRAILHAARRGASVQSYVSSNSEPMSPRMAILINDQTASASEMFARALQAHEVATLVGAPTFGKATLEQTFTLANEYRVKFIVGALYGPRGQSWHAKGLQPDLLVPGREAWNLETTSAEQGLATDAQLRAAWQYLRRSGSSG